MASTGVMRKHYGHSICKWAMHDRAVEAACRSAGEVVLVSA
jgi:hypothetical protein